MLETSFLLSMLRSNPNYSLKMVFFPYHLLNIFLDRYRQASILKNSITNDIYSCNNNYVTVYVFISVCFRERFIIIYKLDDLTFS